MAGDGGGGGGVSKKFVETGYIMHTVDMCSVRIGRVREGGGGSEGWRCE